MKTTTLILSLITLQAAFCTLSAQKSIIFDYDKSGNLIQRRIQTMPSARLAAPGFNQDSLPVVNYSVYPNPASQSIYVQGPLPAQVKEAKLSIMNLEGQVLKTDVYRGDTKTIPVGDLANGLYLLEVRYSKKQAASYKIIISNY